MQTSRLRVRLRDVEPVVERVLDVPSEVLLAELHDLLQAGLGWTDSHLHQFVADGALYGVPDLDGPEEERDEAGVALRALPVRFGYLYDFGDGWEHEVEVLGAGGEQPGCVSGAGPCPPEDVGGPPGYAEFRAALPDPGHPDHDRLRTWAGSWRDQFDREATDLVVRQTAGAVPAPVRLVLELTAGGMKLTAGGRFPRAFARQVQDRYPHWEPLGRPASSEDDLPALGALHALLRKAGLLRLRHGVVSPTRAAGDDVEVVRRLRRWFGPDSGFTTVLVGESLAILATAGPMQPHDLAGRVFPQLGGRWRTGGGAALTEAMTRSELYHLSPVLMGLDLVESDWSAWSAGPSARWLLPRATALADLWSRWGAP